MIIFGMVINQESLKRPEGKRTSNWEEFVRTIHVLHKIVYKNPILGFFISAFLLLSVPTVMASNNLTGRTIEFVKAGIDFKKGADAFVNYNPPNNSTEGVQTDKKIESENTETVHENEKSAMSGENTSLEKDTTANVVVDETEEWLNSHPYSEQELATELLISDSEKKIVYHLSEEEYQQIFFLTGKYRIEDWNDQEWIDEQVRRRVQDLLNGMRENAFDVEGGAPEFLKSEIEQARIRDEQTQELKEKKEIIEIRNNAYRQYPK